MTPKKERELDRALRGRTDPADPATTELLDIADRLDESLSIEAPPARRERAMFVAGIGGRGDRRLGLRLAVPAVALVAALGVTAWMSRNASPGQTLFPVREALAEAGLANTPLEDVNELIVDARERLRQATDALPDGSVVRPALFRALTALQNAREHLGELGGAIREQKEEEIEELEEQAADLFDDMLDGEEAGDGSGPGPGDDRGGDDSSGPGSGDDSVDDSGGSRGDDDSSGSGSGSGDDSSGSGSGGDDSSGSGSGDDDSSGSGSGSGSDDDSSGSGSGSSGSGGSG